MIDREKVKKGLECCKARTDEDPFPGCSECPYNYISISVQDCRSVLSADALELLKEQEAVEPKTGHWIYLQFCANEGVYCSECHTKMFDRYPMKKKLSQFCGHCGAKMERR